MDKTPLDADSFFKRWRQIGGAPRESQRIFGLINGRKMGDATWTHQIAERLGWEILKGVDPNGKNVVGASVCHTSNSKVGCLLRLEPNWDTQVRSYSSILQTTTDLASDVPDHNKGD